MTTKTRKQYLGNEGTVKAYFGGHYDEGYSRKDGDSGVFFEGDTIYSYGYHFPMAVRVGNLYFINADTFSNSTGKQQGLVRYYAQDKKSILIPFSSLRSAGIDVKGINVIETENARQVQVPVRKDGVTEMVDRHLMGSTVFEYNGSYFISGIDETAKDLWKGFFLTELTGSVSSIEHAYIRLMPTEVVTAKLVGEDVKRQGEYFFVPLSEDELAMECFKEKNPNILKGEALKHKAHDQNKQGFEFINSRHVVTRYLEVLGRVFAKGTCRHVAGEHRMLKLDTWHEVFENEQIKSWSSEGRVD